MNNKQTDPEAFRTLQLMSELENEQAVSQRELAGRLGVAVGLVNSYLKNFVAKGYVRVKNYPRNRYAYLLTPKGIAEKSRLAYQHLSYFNHLYTVVRQDFLVLFVGMREQGCDKVLFCGVDEVAEIAYLSLQEVGLELAGVIDFAGGGTFIGRPVQPLQEWCAFEAVPLVLTSLKRSSELRSGLAECGFPAERILALPG